MRSPPPAKKKSTTSRLMFVDTTPHSSREKPSKGEKKLNSFSLYFFFTGFCQLRFSELCFVFVL